MTKDLGEEVKDFPFTCTAAWMCTTVEAVMAIKGWQQAADPINSPLFLNFAAT